MKRGRGYVVDLSACTYVRLPMGPRVCACVHPTFGTRVISADRAALLVHLCVSVHQELNCPETAHAQTSDC